MADETVPLDIDHIDPASLLGDSTSFNMTFASGDGLDWSIDNIIAAGRAGQNIRRGELVMGGAPFLLDRYNVRFLSNTTATYQCHTEDPTIKIGTPLTFQDYPDNARIITWHPPIHTNCIVGFAESAPDQNGGLLMTRAISPFPERLQWPPKMVFTDVSGDDDYLHGFYRKMDEDNRLEEPLVPLFIAETLQMQGKESLAKAWLWIYDNQKHPIKRQRLVEGRDYWDWGNQYSSRNWRGTEENTDWLRHMIPLTVFSNLQIDPEMPDGMRIRSHYKRLSTAFRDLAEALCPYHTPLPPIRGL